jgi:hypothetical protein
MPVYSTMPVVAGLVAADLEICCCGVLRRLDSFERKP